MYVLVVGNFYTTQAVIVEAEKFCRDQCFLGLLSSNFLCFDDNVLCRITVALLASKRMSDGCLPNKSCVIPEP